MDIKAAQVQETARPIAPRIPELSFKDYPKKPFFYKGLPVRFLKNKCLFLLSQEENLLSIVIENVEDEDTLDALRLATGFQVKVFQGKREEIIKAIELHYESGENSVGEIVDGIVLEKGSTISIEGEDEDHLRDLASEAPIIRLVSLIVARAIERGASDIHLEPFENSLRVRYRIDDILHEVESMPKHLHAATTSRIKIMANLNIAERRLPQDGRFKMSVADRDIDVRVSCMPTSYGESVVLRILDRDNLVLSFEALGFSGDNERVYREMMSRPYGMILVTGPTGSGKTTTLYTTLETLNNPNTKIVTIEDPVEYHLHGVNQVQIKPQIGLTFANGLRHILRQDPNIIMVGEIRDRETAEIAIHSALTGHLVFSTLHTNDASGAIARLLEMGVEDYLLASSLIGIIAQRLVRVICSQCKVSYCPEQYETQKLGLRIDDHAHRVFKGKGCEECGNTGYRGRVGIYETLPIKGEIRSLILKNPEASKIKSRAIETGMKTLREDGIQKIFQGVTTFDEVIRVTQGD